MDALEKTIGGLKSVDLSHELPSMEALCPAILYAVDFDSNFEDRGAFITGMNKFIEEASVLNHLNDIVEEGTKFYCPLIYSWRCLSRAFPDVSDDTPNKASIYETCFKILKPEIDSLINFFRFCTTAKEAFTSEITKACHPERRKDVQSEGIVNVIGLLLDLFLKLDNLKDAKTSMKNDFACYKRIETIIKKATDTTATHEIASLSFFLATPNEIMSSIKKSIETVDGYQDLLISVMDSCLERVEKELFITPQQKHQDLRIIVTILTILSGEKSTLGKLEQKKKISLARIDKVIRDVPSVPLIGDMHTNLQVLVKKLVCNYDFSYFESSYIGRMISTVFNSTLYIDSFQEEHFRYVSELTLLLNAAVGKNKGTDYKWKVQEADYLYNLSIHGLKLLTKWNVYLQELYAFKMGHPVDRNTLGNIQDCIDSYALATKYNYKPEEKVVCAKIIFFVRSLYNKLSENETLFQSAINAHIYTQLQNLGHNILKEIDRKTQKSKKHLFRAVLSSLIEITCDTIQFKDDNNRGKKNKGNNNDILPKSVAPLSTQLYMVRTMLNTLVTNKELKKELDGNFINQITTFLNDSILFKQISNFGKCLRDCSDMSQFWFKEFYLEIAGGKHIQFPIDMSFPWIICEWLIESNDSSNYEYLLYTLDLYNDSGQYCLEILKSQILFDEIDSEVFLCFQQFAYLMSEKLYYYIKSVACSCLFDKGVKNEVVKRIASADKTIPTEGAIPFQTSQHFINIVRQRRVHLLGRDIDFNHLLGQRLLTNIKKSLEYAFQLLEASSFESIMEFTYLIQAIELTHDLLCENFDLPSFYILFKEANNDIGSSNNRIIFHILIDIIDDLIPNSSFSISTHRFIRSPVLYSKDTQKDPPPKVPVHHLFGTRNLSVAFSEMSKIYSGYVGAIHFDHLIKYLDYKGVAFLIEELKKFANALISGSLLEYIKVLMSGMPAKCILPKVAYGFKGVVEYYNANFESILKYKQLESGFIHRLRELGNCVAVIYMLEQALFRHESSCLLLSAPQQGLLPTIQGLKPADPSFSLTKLASNFKYSMIGSSMFSYLDEKGSIELKKSSLLGQERLCCGMNFLDSFISSFKSSTSDPIWRGSLTDNRVVSVDECIGFHRLFSAVLYYLISPSTQSKLYSEEIFGHGVYFGGLSLIHVLNQENLFDAFDFVSHAVYVSEMEGLTRFSNFGLSSPNTKATVKTSRANKETLKDGSQDSRMLLSNMRSQIITRKYISNILANLRRHETYGTTQSIKFFSPPKYTKV